VSSGHRPVGLALFAVLFASALAAAQSPTSNLRERAREPYLAGLAQMRQEAFDAARRSFETALDIDPTFELAHFMLGRVHLAQKNYAAAVGALRRSRDLYIAEASRQFINKQEGQRFRRDRLAELDDMISALQAKTPQTFQDREQIRQLEERKRQVQDLDRAKDLTPEQQVPAFVSLSLGSAYFRLGRREEAEQAFVAAVTADPKTGEAHNNLAVVYFETGRYEQAKASVRAAEKAGLKVHPELKAQIDAKTKSQ
jgi:tetratricopeptide (TPR) repeat protein